MLAVRYKKLLLALLILVIVLVSGCESSFEDCTWSCEHTINKDICTDDTDFWDGKTMKSKSRIKGAMIDHENNLLSKAKL